jgi:peptidylprolyl isomerase
MKKLSINEWVGVGAALTLAAFFFMLGNPLHLIRAGERTQAGVESVQMGSYATDDDNALSLFEESKEEGAPEGGLIIQDKKIGKGEEARPGQIVTVYYVGMLKEGGVFDSTADHEPFQFVLGAGQVIEGWDRGLRGMKVGGIRVLTIPPELGYGDQPVGSIPAHSTLVFEIELLGVQNRGELR